LLLFFLPDALEGLVVRFLIHEAASVSVPLRPAVVLGVVNLRAVPDRSVSVSIAFRRVGSHNGAPLFSEFDLNVFQGFFEIPETLPDLAGPISLETDIRATPSAAITLSGSEFAQFPGESGTALRTIEIDCHVGKGIHDIPVSRQAPGSWLRAFWHRQGCSDCSAALLAVNRERLLWLEVKVSA
jgi:hypothetical protein